MAAGVALSAREAGAELIVVASRRPGDWSSLINGSVGHDVLRQANRMVLLAPLYRRGSAGQTG